MDGVSTHMGRWALAATIGVLAPTAQAVELRPTVRIGYEAGGDNLVTVTYTNGDTSDIRAGEGLILGGGVSILNDAKNLELELTVNAKIQLVAARNANVTWVRFPLDAVVFYRMSKFRFGAGATYHLSPEVSGSGDASHVKQTYDPAFGYVIQADYLFSGAGEGKGAYLGVRYTSIDYKLEGGGFKAGANSFGLHLGYRF